MRRNRDDEPRLPVDEGAGGGGWGGVGMVEGSQSDALRVNILEGPRACSPGKN